MEAFLSGISGVALTLTCGFITFVGGKILAFLSKTKREHTTNNQVAAEHGPLKAAVEEIQANGATKEDIAKLHEAIEAITHMVELMKGSDLDMIRNSIIRICNEATGQGWIDNHQLRSLCDLYDRYKKLGGNGYVDEMVAHAKALPVRNIKKGFIARLVARLAA